MPFFTNQVTSNVPEDYASHTFSSTYSSEQEHTDEIEYTWTFRKQTNHVTYGVTEAYTYKPFENQGQKLYGGLTSYRSTRSEQKYSFEQGGVNSNNNITPPSNRGEGFNVISIENDGTGRTSTTARTNFALFGYDNTEITKSTTNDIPRETITMQLTSIEYTNDGFTTTERKHEGAVEFFITSVPINQNNVIGETWVTSSSWNATKQGAVVVHRDINDLTKKFTTSGFFDSGEVDLVTQHGNTILKYEQTTWSASDIRFVALSTFPYNRSDHNGNAYEDTIYVHTRHTYTKATLYDWYSSDTPPDIFSEIGDSHVFTQTHYCELVEETNTDTPNDNSLTLSAEWGYHHSRDRSLSWLNGTTGPQSQHQKTSDISNEGVFQDIMTLSQTTEENTQITYAFGLQDDPVEDEYLANIRTDAKSNKQGGWVNDVASSSSSVTIMSSTLTEAFCPWDKSIHFGEEAIRAMGGWRNENNVRAVTFNTASVESTIREAETLEIIRNQDPTDVESIIVPEITTFREHHEIEDIGAALPMFAQVLPTTASKEQIMPQHGLLTAGDKYDQVQTMPVYEPPLTKEHVDEFGNKSAWLEYTATKSEYVSKILGAEPVTISRSLEQNYKDADVTTEETTREPSVFYGRGRSSVGQEAYEKFGIGGDFGKYEINTASVVTTDKKCKAYPTISSYLSSSFSSVTLSSRYYSIRGSGESIEVECTGKGFNPAGVEPRTFVRSYPCRGGSMDYSVSNPTISEKNVRSRKEEYEQFYSSKQHPREGTADRPYIVCHTYSTGKHGYIYVSSIRESGSTYNFTDEVTYKQIGYSGIERIDFKPFENPLKLTTGGFETRNGFNTSLMPYLDGGLLTYSSFTNTFQTYYKTYKVSVDFDMDGWMEFCLTDIVDDTIYSINRDELTYPENSNYCLQVIYSDACGNSKEFGIGMGMSSNTTPTLGQPVNYETYLQTNANGDYEIVDQFGNHIRNARSTNQNPLQPRNVGCGAFTWTYLSTYFEEDFTIPIKSSTVITEKIKGTDIMPPYLGMQTYYGAVHYPDQLYTTGDIWMPENGWYNPIEDSLAKYNADWLNRIFQNNIGGMNHIFDMGRDLYNGVDQNDTRIQRWHELSIRMLRYNFGGFPISPHFYNSTNHHYNQARLDSSSYLPNMMMGCRNEHLINGLVRSQKMFTRTTACEGYNTALGEFYASGLGRSADNFEMYKNHPEYRTNWIDGRRNNPKLIVGTKKFQKGVFAMGHSSKEGDTTSYSNAYIMDHENLAGRFTSNSRFLSSWLENTHYTLTSEVRDGRKDFYYITKSSKLATIESGNDGVWRHSVESETSGIETFSINKQEANFTTFLSGNFMLGSSSPMYYQECRNTIPIVEPNCCGCLTYDTDNPMKWTQGGVTDDISRDIGGQYRISHENVIGGNMTIAMLGVGSYWDDYEINTMPLPYKFSKKHFSENEWQESNARAEVDQVGTDIITLQDEIISYEVPEMYLMHPHRPFGYSLNSTNDTFSVNFFLHIARPCVYDEYDRMGVKVNLKPVFLNAHLTQSFLGEYVESASENFMTYGAVVIPRQIYRNQNFPDYQGEYTDELMVHINNTKKARLEYANEEHKFFYDLPQGDPAKFNYTKSIERSELSYYENKINLDELVTSEWGKYSFYHTTE